MDYVWLLWLYEDVCMVDSKAVLNPVMVVSVVVIASAAHCTPLTSSLTSSWPTSVWLTPTNIHTWFVPLFRIFTFLLFLHVSFFKFFFLFFLIVSVLSFIFQSTWQVYWFLSMLIIIQHQHNHSFIVLLPILTDTVSLILISCLFF